MPAARRAPRAAALLATLPIAVSVSACAPTDSGTASAPSGSASASCAKSSLALVTPGKLTVATDKPAYDPWFSNDDPANGKGFESAVAYAVAGKLGFDRTEVSWKVAAFNTVIAPGTKPYDFDVNQVSISADRRKAVDFSSGYYDVQQAVVAIKGNKAAGARSLADLRGVKLGAEVGTTSYQAIQQVIKPTGQPAVFDDNDKAKLALQNGQIDGLVVDLPTALFLAAAELTNGVVVGQVPSAVTGGSEQFGLVLSKGSKLTSCLTGAVDALRADGTLKRLEQQWLTDAAGAPVLK